MLFLLLHMLYRSNCHQVSNQADKLALLAIILLSADVKPIYSSGLPQGNAFSPRITWVLHRKNTIGKPYLELFLKTQKEQR